MFKPLNNRILVKPDKPEEETKGGIILVDMAKEKPVTGIVEVGNGKVKKGERILFSRIGFDEVEIDKEIYCVVSDFNILGKF